MKKKEVDCIIDEAMKSREKILTEMVESDPELADVKAPQALYDDFFAQVREYEKEQAKKLSPEQEELIRLGTIYKKRKKWNKVVVLIAAVVCLLAFGVTSIGGPKRILEEFNRTIGGREQTYVNNDEERGMEIDDVEELEAYDTIEEKFGTYPVKMYYLPAGMEFMEVVIEEETQNVRMFYEGKNEQTIAYTVLFNYRATSIGTDYEDELLKKYAETVNGVDITIRQLAVDNGELPRWNVEFEYQNAYYDLAITGVSEYEIQEIVKNLNFF